MIALLFVIENDIDMVVHQTMSEADFKEVGITSFGLRRKVVLTIHKLKSPACDDSASSVPSEESEIASASDPSCPDFVSPKRSSSSSTPQISTPKSIPKAYSMGPLTSPLVIYLL